MATRKVICVINCSIVQHSWRQSIIFHIDTYKNTVKDSIVFHWSRLERRRKHPNDIARMRCLDVNLEQIPFQIYHCRIFQWLTPPHPRRVQKWIGISSYLTSRHALRSITLRCFLRLSDHMVLSVHCTLHHLSLVTLRQNSRF